MAGWELGLGVGARLAARRGDTRRFVVRPFCAVHLMVSWGRLKFLMAEIGPPHERQQRTALVKVDSPLRTGKDRTGAASVRRDI